MTYAALSWESLADLRSFNCTQQQIAVANDKAINALETKQRRLVVSWNAEITTGKKDITLMLIGKTGAGKSSTGNLILGNNVFKEDNRSLSCTSDICVKAGHVDGIWVTVIDTPGLCDTGRSTGQVLTQIAKAMKASEGRIDAYLFVFSCGNPRFTMEEKFVFEQIRLMDNQNQDIINNCFVVMTKGDDLVRQTSLLEYMEEEGTGSDFGILLNRTVQRRVIAVENSETTTYGRNIQRVQIIRMVLIKYLKGSYCAICDSRPCKLMARR